MEIIAHRGASGLAPENTISSFKKAEELGVSMLECDLRQTKDQKIVLSHDAELSRVYHLNFKIKDLTLSQIKFETRKSGQEILELSEFLAIADRPINLEIKVSGIEKDVLAAIKGFAHKVLITSWNPLIIKKIRALDGNILIGPVVEYRHRFFLPIIIWLLKNINIFSITIRSELVNPRSMERFKKLGWKVFSYPVNTPALFEKVKQLGVDGVFTGRPDIIKQ